MELSTAYTSAPALDSTLALHQAALRAALEAIPAPAFLVSITGTIVLTNAAARSTLADDGQRIAHALATILSDAADPTLTVTELAIPGLPTHFLVVSQRPREDSAARAASFSRRLKLTPRQSEVLELVCVGHSNKTIAALLGRAEVTVELHVTALLQKAKVENRAMLVARFWTEV